MFPCWHSLVLFRDTEKMSFLCVGLCGDTEKTRDLYVWLALNEWSFWSLPFSFWTIQTSLLLYPYLFPLKIMFLAKSQDGSVSFHVNPFLLLFRWCSFQRTKNWILRMCTYVIFSHRILIWLIYIFSFVPAIVPGNSWCLMDALLLSTLYMLTEFQ